MMEDSKLYGNRLAASQLAISPKKSHGFEQDNEDHMRLDLNVKAIGKAGLMTVWFNEQNQRD